MKFTLQVVFTGLGVALAKGADGTEAGVDLLLLTTSADSMLHLPRLTFCIDDLLKTTQDYYEPQHRHSSPHFAADAQEIELNLEGEDCRIVIDANGAAPDPSALAGLMVPGWIPHIKNDLGIPDLKIPDTVATPYISRVRLPPGGAINSRRLFLTADGTPMAFTFGDDPHTLHVLAEQWVWTIGGVTAAALEGCTKFKPLSLDPMLRTFRLGPPVVQIAVTNLPAAARPKRLGSPEHFPMYKWVSTSGKDPYVVAPVTARPITPSGACPPVQGSTL